MGRWGCPEALPKFCLASGCADAPNPGFFHRPVAHLVFSSVLFSQVRGHLQGCGKIHEASGVAGGAAEFLLGEGMRLIEGVQVNEGESLDDKMPVVSQAHVGKKMPRRSRRFVRVLKGEGSRSK
jgi:hypothetical protein